mmetsp:Transcript_43572/g.140434  ORF Transcript_43572/g.140434 Transcript_43572/m.140434 type:complete len:240 (+) Transcript_43572:817-1536(+)
MAAPRTPAELSLRPRLWSTAIASTGAASAAPATASASSHMPPSCSIASMRTSSPPRRGTPSPRRANRRRRRGGQKRASRRAPHARRADHVGRAEQGAQEPRRHARVLRAAEGGQLQQVPREAGLASALRAQLDPRLVSLATRASDASARIPCRGRRRRRLASAAAGRFCSRPRGARGAQPALVRPIPRGVASFGSRSRSACLRQLRAVRRGRRVHKGRRLLRGCSRRLSSSRRRRRRRL